MRKVLLLALAICLGFALSGKSDAQHEEFTTVVLSGTADVLIDSSMTATYMNNKRLYINGVYAWWDNAANTNQVFVEVVRGTVNMATQGAGRQFKYSEAMTSSGIKGVTLIPNITTSSDSTIFFVIQATGSDSLFLAVNYKVIGE